MSRSDFVSLEVEGQRLDCWSEYSVDSDLFSPADGFEFTVEVGGGTGRVTRRRFDELRELLKKHAQVRLYVGDDVTGGAARRRYIQLTGRIDDPEIDQSRERGTQLKIKGRDNGAYLVDSCVRVSLLHDEGAGFLDLVRAAVQPWSIEVAADATASRDVLTGRGVLTPEERLSIEEARQQGVPVAAFSRQLRRRAERRGQPLDETMGVQASDRTRRRTSNGMVGSDVERLTARRAQPRAGETVWEFLSRHAERLGLMLWFSPTGKLIVSAPRYDQEPLYRFVRRWENDPRDPQTILAGGRAQTGSGQFSEVTVFGRVRGSDATRSAFHATITDDSVPYERRLIVHDNAVRSQDEALRRAKREVRRRNAESDVLNYELPDHGLHRYLYAIDTVASVVDEPTGAEGLWYVVKRTFRRSRAQGTTTSVRLVPSGSIQL